MLYIICSIISINNFNNNNYNYMMYKLFVVLARALVSCGDVLLPGLPAMLGSARVAVAREGAQAAVAALVVPAGVALVVPAGAALVVPVGAALVVPAGVSLVPRPTPQQRVDYITATWK